MISFKQGEPITWPGDRIGLNVNEDGSVTIFQRGDETTPEWLALHPPAPTESPAPASDPGA